MRRMNLFLYIPDAYLLPRIYFSDLADIKRAESVVHAGTMMLAKGKFPFRNHVYMDC